MSAALRRMLGLVAVVAPAVVLVALAWLAATRLMRDEFDAAVSNAYRQNANLALAFEQHSVTTVRSVDRVLKLVLEAYAEGRTLDSAGLDHAREINSDFSIAVLVTDAAGRVTAGNALEALDLSDREFFVRHRDKDPGTVLVGVPVHGRLSGRLIIPISRRMSFADGRFRGVVVAGVDPVEFVSYYRQMELGSSSMVQVVGLDGATRVRRTGTYISSPSANSSTLLKLQAVSDRGNFLSAGVLEGVKRYTSFRTSREFELIVAVGTAQADVLETYALRRDAFIAAASFFTLAVVLFTGLMLVSMRGKRRVLAETLRREAQFRATFHQSAIGIGHLGLDGRFLKVNEALCQLLRLPESDLLERVLADLKAPDERTVAQGVIAALLRDGAMAPAEGNYLRGDGSVLCASLALAIVRGPGGEPEYLVAMMQDIGERVAAQEQVLRRSQFDPLTDLPNRALFSDRLGQALNQARRRHSIVAVMFIDLDGFKPVNDTLGHAAGDSLLREVAQRLAGALRAGDTAARMGGDEFAVVLSEVSQGPDAAIVARRILRALAAPMTIEGQELAVTASIGIALFPEHGQDEVDLMRKADAAMFAAKQAGKNAFRTHDPARAVCAA
jgi:diguanylate cyclase (GGDEF)-like protein/PAS domain S-box-containing protein